jgi:glycerol-1-phosphate dehydrogenase [NAD(P)+]
MREYFADIIRRSIIEKTSGSNPVIIAPSYLLMCEYNSGLFVIEDRLHLSPPFLIVSGEKTYKIAGESLRRTLAGRYGKKKTDVLTCESYPITTEYLENLEEKLSDTKANAVFAVGGGNVIDLGKIVSERLDAIMISVPTSAAHDGIASPYAVIKENGKKKSVKTKTPLAILVDMPMLSKSDRRFKNAGFGDLLSNYTSAHDWKLSAKKGEKYYSKIGIIAEEAAAFTFTLLKRLPKPIRIQKEILETLVAGLWANGAWMQIAESTAPCSGSEHNFSHAINYLFSDENENNEGKKRKKTLHGEEVALGTLWASYLQRKDWKNVRKNLNKLGLPITAEQLGLTKEQAKKVALEAPHIRKRHTILNEFRTEKPLINALEKTKII